MPSAEAWSGHSHHVLELGWENDGAFLSGKVTAGDVMLLSGTDVELISAAEAVEEEADWALAPAAAARMATRDEVGKSIADAGSCGIQFAM